MTKPVAKQLSDYRPPAFNVKNLHLEFHLEPEKTKVISRFRLQRLEPTVSELVLDGEGLELISVKIDGSEVSSYRLDDTTLTLPITDDLFDVEIVNHCFPAKNTSLEGLYYASGAFCTQCEAEGFRKITYFLDRPDVLTQYSVKLIADKTNYPYLLSNGNKVSEGDLENGQHFVEWKDPFNKPCYLFAVVAGDFDVLNDRFVTMRGREVSLQLFVEKGQASKGQHALDSLKKSMKWDEETFGLEYDLDIYMIVAVDFFNMGAMENKGLNVFNSKFVLADAETATDEDFFNIESIIAHEYFHNWTGNRVTCRDWFQLSLKEGLTVFRDQKFSEDVFSQLAARINQVKVIKEHQFAEDAGPMSHPIRPESVIEMNNFYTVTVYDKGAEVIRMMYTILGESGFSMGMKLYFERHDGQAVTCDDFVNAMQDASSVDLSLFKKWYSQSGTPTISVKEEFDEASGRYQLRVSQHHNPTADQAEKSDLHIPIAYELLDSKTQEVITSDVLNLKHKEDVIEASGLQHKPVPVLLKGFSAPVKLSFSQPTSELLISASCSTDDLSRWDASQQIYSRSVWDVYNKQDKPFDALCQFSKALFERHYQDPTLLAEMIRVPSSETLMGQQERIEVDKLLDARDQVLKCLSVNVAERCFAILKSAKQKPYNFNSLDAAQRALESVCLFHVANAGYDKNIAIQTFENANNMTDALGALKALRQSDIDAFDNAMAKFESTWQGNTQVLDKWLALHAGASRPDILSRLDLLSAHSTFDINNPNRVRALIGTFAFYNPSGFHCADGSGYRYVADYLIKLNKINPQVAARVITPFLSWQKFDDKRQSLIKNQLMRIADVPDISRDLFEKVSKSLQI